MDTSKGMVKRRKKGKRKARRTAQQPTQFARPLRCSAALAALLKPHCEMGTDARLAVGGALLLTRAAATRVLWRYARARGLQDPNDGRRLVLTRDALGGVLGVASATITELPSLLAPHLASDGASLTLRGSGTVVLEDPVDGAEPPEGPVRDSSNFRLRASRRTWR